jgi:hypothetical protein
LLRLFSGNTGFTAAEAGSETAKTARAGVELKHAVALRYGFQPTREERGFFGFSQNPVRPEWRSVSKDHLRATAF